MNDLINVQENNGMPVVSSREVAERFGKEHKTILKQIEGEVRKGVHIDGLSDQIKSGGNPPDCYFIKSEYIDPRNRKQKEYLLTRDGFSLLVMGFTGQAALEWKLKYIEAFNKMESRIKEQNAKALPATYKQALIQLLEEVEKNEKLLNEVDRYQRFLCEKTQKLTKTELATKLDTKVQTLAATLKDVGVYTKTSQISSDFLKKYPDVKLIVENVCEYVNNKTGDKQQKVDWQWTYEGAKAVVDFLIEKGCVNYTENDGFKLSRKKA